jgi:hypothetical protein
MDWTPSKGRLRQPHGVSCGLEEDLATGRNGAAVTVAVAVAGRSLGAMIARHSLPSCFVFSRENP